MDGLKTIEQVHVNPSGISSEVAKSEKVNEKKDVTKEKEQASKKENEELQLEEAVEKFSNAENSASIQFKVGKDDGKTIIEISDKSTGEVLRTIPNKEALKIAQNIEDFLDKSNEKGLAIDDKV